MKNLYRLQAADLSGYHPMSKDRVNHMVETGRAEWVGTDWDENLNAYVHYADRVEQ